jgi:hypothetical protein
VFTGEVLGRLADHRVPDVNFGIEEGGRRYLCVHGGDRLYADDPVRADGTVPMVDFAVIARIRSPWAAGKHIFLIAGVNAIGTHACGDFLADPMNYRKLPWREDDLVEVFKVSFVDHDPYNYRYELEQLSLGPQT